MPVAKNTICFVGVVLLQPASNFMFARASGLVPGELVHVIADAHIYDRHVPIVERILDNPRHSAPQLEVDPAVTDFYAFTRDSFSLPGYKYTELDEKIPVAL